MCSSCEYDAPSPEECVKAGALLLDDHFRDNPRGWTVNDWRLRIDAEIFDISDPYFCILGQLFGGYIEGKARLGIGSGEPYGFAGLDHQASQKAWLKELDVPERVLEEC